MIHFRMSERGAVYRDNVGIDRRLWEMGNDQIGRRDDKQTGSLPIHRHRRKCRYIGISHDCL